MDKVVTPWRAAYWSLRSTLWGIYRTLKFVAVAECPIACLKRKKLSGQLTAIKVFQGHPFFEPLRPWHALVTPTEMDRKPKCNPWHHAAKVGENNTSPMPFSETHVLSRTA